MNQADKKELMMGNEAIARGLIENGCRIATAYPGTPASEILASVAADQKRLGVDMHTQWAVNEKVALEIAYAGSMAGLRSAVSMKQVGLNVASDPLMSAAYMGCAGGFVIVSADDPGPHILPRPSRTAGMMAMMAKIPVLDPGLSAPGPRRWSLRPSTFRKHSARRSCCGPPPGFVIPGRM